MSEIRQSKSLAIEVIHLHKTFHHHGKSIPVLKDVHFSIPQSSIVGLIGKSGAGKTTALRCLNLLERPEQGEIRIAGQNILKLSEPQLRLIRQKIGVVFQSFNLLSYRTAFENIALPLQIFGFPSTVILQKVNRVAELVGLENRLNFYPAQLSGGQKQRVALARALVAEADILLCDEFTSALDPETTEEMLQLILDLHAKLKMTLVLVSHNMAIVEKLCQHVFVMDHGQVIESGPIYDILSSPQKSVTKALLKKYPSTQESDSYV